MYAYGERWVGRRAEVRLPSAVRMEKGGYLGDGFSRFVLFVSQMYPVYETIGAADRYYMVSRAASLSIVVASLYHRFPPISLASFSRSSAEVFSILSDDAAVLKAEETPKTRLNRLFVFLFGPADCDP